MNMAREVGNWVGWSGHLNRPRNWLETSQEGWSGWVEGVHSGAWLWVMSFKEMRNCVTRDPGSSVLGRGLREDWAHCQGSARASFSQGGANQEPRGMPQLELTSQGSAAEQSRPEDHGQSRPQGNVMALRQVQRQYWPQSQFTQQR